MTILTRSRDHTHPQVAADLPVRSADGPFQLLAWDRFDDFVTDNDGARLTSPVIAVPHACRQLIVSWNADTPPLAALTIEARALYPDHETRWYTLGFWAASDHTPPRTSVNDQKDADGDVETDTLVLVRPAPNLQVRVTRAGAATMRFLALSLADTNAPTPDRPSDTTVWGTELPVPARCQLSYPGGEGWCSPTSVSMVLSYWAQRMERPEWDIDVPACAAGIYDAAWQGTGNWPFNTAFAGSLPGVRAYVTRLNDLRDVEDWIAQGIPVILSVSIDPKIGGDTPGSSGHLVVCIGFTAAGDLIVNDPWAHLDRGETVRRIYRRAHMEALWSRSHHAAYIIHPTTLHPTQEDALS